MLKRLLSTNLPRLKATTTLPLAATINDLAVSRLQTIDELASLTDGMATSLHWLLQILLHTQILTVNKLAPCPNVYHCH